MSVTVRNVRCAAAVLAGVVFVLAQSLFQAGDAGQVLRIHGHIVNPAGAAVIGVSAIDAGHGQAHEEGGGGVRHHLGDAGLDQKVQAQGQIAGGCMPVGVSFRHGNAVIVVGVFLQRVLDSGGVGVQRGAQAVNQGVGAVIEHLDAVHLVVCGSIAVIGADADGREESIVCGIGCDAVQHLHMLHAILRLGVGADVRHLDIGELNSLDGIAVGIAVLVQRGDTGGIAQDRLHAVFILHTGGDIG